LLESVLNMIANTALQEQARAQLAEKAALLLDEEQALMALERAHGSTAVVAAIAPALPSARRKQVLSDLLEHIEQLPVQDSAGGSPRADAFALVAPVLDRDLVPRAVAMVDSVISESVPEEFDQPVCELALQAAEYGYHEVALRLCRAISTVWRGQALAGVVPHLPTGMLPEAEEIAQSVDPAWRRGPAVSLAQRMADGHQTSLLWEAVFAAATPDVWAGAGDLTGALEDLASAITPELVARCIIVRHLPLDGASSFDADRLEHRRPDARLGHARMVGRQPRTLPQGTETYWEACHGEQPEFPRTCAKRLPTGDVTADQQGTWDSASSAAPGGSIRQEPQRQD
jgi:hypothetical protein